MITALLRVTPVLVWLHYVPAMIQLNKPNDPLSSPAKTLESDWSFMLTATSIYGKGAPGAPFLVQAADCFMTRQDWISRPTDGGSKRIYLKRLGITSPCCCACWMQVGRPRFCRMISILSERRAVLSVLQRFQHLMYRAATDLGYMDVQARLIVDVLSRQTKYQLYKPTLEFLTRSLPQECRDQLLQWISTVRLQNRTRTRNQQQG